MAGKDEVLVAFDASDDAVAGLEWAVAEAKRVGAPLRILYVEQDIPVVDAGTTALVWLPPTSYPARPGEPITAAGVTRAHEFGIEAEAEIAYGPPPAVLAARSQEARMLVIGSRGLGALRGAMLGSTSLHVAVHAHCPVIVVHQGSADGPVVVGVDGSPESLQTLDWAASFASRHGRALHVLYAYELPIYPEVVPYVPPADEIDQVVSAADQALASEVTGLAARYPGLAITTEAVRERAAYALAEASRTASLVVVGSHGRGGFTGMLLGSTATSVLNHAHGTIAVIHHEKAKE